MKKTVLMLWAEGCLGGPLEARLPARVQDTGLKSTAIYCGAATVTVHRWMLMLGYRLRYVKEQATCDTG